jgi:hypothetical protein
VRASVRTDTVSSGVVDAIVAVLADLATCAALLVLPTFHLRLFQQSSFLRRLLSLLAILNLVLSDEGKRRNTIDVLVFAEFANPHIFRLYPTVPILILLLLLPVECLQRILLRGIPTRSRFRCRRRIGT